MARHHQQPRTGQFYKHQDISPKKPPGWDPAYNSDYPFDTWIKDLGSWQHSTDVDANKQGALVQLQLGGLAREFVLNLDVAIVRNGGRFLNRGAEIEGNGLLYIITQLRDHFEVMDTEEQEDVMNNLRESAT